MGNVGYFVAKFLTEWGMRLVAVGDQTSYRAHAEGLSLPKRGVTVDCWASGHTINKARFFATSCDVIIPAALEMQIDKAVAQTMRCRYVVEAANGPITPEGETELEQRHIKIVPDILANAGGVIVSYYEWVQNTQNERWSEEVVREKMEARMLPVVAELRVHTESSRVLCFHRALRNLEEAFSELHGNRGV